MSDREYIFESSSPICHIDAAVAAEKDAYYLYFFCSPEYGAKVLNKLWICNRHETPAEMDMSPMDRGEGPLLGKENVSELQPQYGMELNPDKLSCVWYDTGDAAAIYYGKKLICAIPPIAGLYDFPGFSIFAKGQTRYAWEMPKEPEFEKAVNDSKQFWEIINNENTWKKLEQDYISVADNFFGSPHTKCFPADKGHFPHSSIVQGSKNGIDYNITIGVSQFAMPTVAQAFGNDCGDQSRIELGFATQQKYHPVIDLMSMVMPDVAKMPWDERSFLWHGHTFDFPNIHGFADMLFINPVYVEGMESPSWRNFSGCKVNTLWLVPITEREFQYKNEHGVEELLKKCPYPEKLHIFNNMPKFLI